MRVSSSYYSSGILIASSDGNQSCASTRKPGLRSLAREFRLHVDDRRKFGGHGVGKRFAEFLRLLDGRAEAVERPGDLSEIRLAVLVAFALPVLFAALVRDVEIAQPLRQAVIVVDDGHRLDAPAARGFQFRKMVEESPVAAKADDRLVGCGAFRSEGGGKGPAERPGRAEKALIRVTQIDERAGPHGG